MDKQNVTLSLSRETLIKAKLIAVRQNKSLSSLLTEALEDIVAKDERYELAKEQELLRMKHGLKLGTNGKATWTRDELHAR